MKRYLSYVLGVIGLLALIAVLLGARKERPRKMDEHLSFRYNDKIPYGYYCAYHLLPALFPKAKISVDRRAPGNWDSLSMEKNNQAVFLVAPELGAENYELDKLLDFAKQGNHVFIITRSMSYEASEFFHMSVSDIFSDDGLLGDEDSLALSLEVPPFNDSSSYVYPGKRFSSLLMHIDSVHSQVLGRNKSAYPDFIQYKAGKGSISIHLAPLAFSNYFILHKNNLNYFRNVVSVIPDTVSQIVWNEYYLQKPHLGDYGNKEKEPDWLDVLFRYREFKWSLLTIFAALLLFVLLGMRRNQRMIPALARPQNESLDFVKTLGRLYYERKDHADLARKMSVYFLEYIRSKYQLPTQDLDKNFIEALQFKSGYPLSELNTIISFINFLNTAPAITDLQLTEFYRKLELFYQNA